MKLAIVPAALEELQDTVEYYISVGNVALGRAFVDEFDRVTALVLATPALGRKFRGAFRQYSFRKFPYRIIYKATAAELRIYAVAHHRRRPGYWTGRPGR